jgi:spermidine synthase
MERSSGSWAQIVSHLPEVEHLTIVESQPRVPAAHRAVPGGRELAESHLNPDGIHYFNTTSSDEAQRTAAVFFPYAMRVTNFIAVSDAHQRDVFTHVMEFADSIDQPYDFHALETRANVLARTVGATEVTDDNMACEWKDPLHFPGAPE